MSLVVDGWLIRARIADLSASGMLIFPESILYEGAKALITFRLPDSDAPVEVVGTLIRRASGGAQGFGVEFLYMPPETATRLVAFVSRRRSTAPPQEENREPRRFWGEAADITVRINRRVLCSLRKSSCDDGGSPLERAIQSAVGA